MKIKYIIYAAISILLIYLIYNRITKNKELKGDAGATKGGASNALKVNGVVLKTVDFANTISVSGTIEANEMIQIRSEISGLVRSINFKEGSNVSKGNLLLKIDDRELQAQLA